jgi:hypothetical protein
MGIVKCFFSIGWKMEIESRGRAKVDALCFQRPGDVGLWSERVADTPCSLIARGAIPAE